MGKGDRRNSNKMLKRRSQAQYKVRHKRTRAERVANAKTKSPKAVEEPAATDDDEAPEPE